MAVNVDNDLDIMEQTKPPSPKLLKFNKQPKLIKLSLGILFALIMLATIIFAALYFSQKPCERAEFTTTESGNDQYSGKSQQGTESASAESKDDQYLGTHIIYNRSKWDGRRPQSYRNITSPVPMVIIKHTGGGPCFTFQICAGKLQTIQSQAVSRGAPDIYYNFLIGGDENIYVGRGWNVHPQQRDDVIDIAFMGSYAFDKLTPGMIDAALELIHDGVKNSKLTKDYKIVCDNQTQATESPGLNIHKEVTKWPHYDSGLYFDRQHLISTP